MTNSFRKLMRDQLQEVTQQAKLIMPPPKKGWIRAIRDSLGMPANTLAKRLGCSRANVSYLERSEKAQTITLDKLEQIAKAMNCQLVYCFVPQKSLNEIMKDQARDVAKRHIGMIDHSMRLEGQGLTMQQLKHQEDDLVETLLQGNPKHLWETDEN